MISSSLNNTVWIIKHFTHTLEKMEVSMKNIIKRIVSFFVSLIPKDPNKVLAYLEGNKTEDGLFPYHDDSVYLICERLKERYPNLQIEYFYDNIAKYDPENAKRHLRRQFLYSLRAYYVIGANFPFKAYHTKNQKILITGYYTPFKADRFIENYVDEKYGAGYVKRYAKMSSYFDSYNYTYLVSSRYSLNIISASMGIPAHKFKVLGLARNEILQKEVTQDVEEMFSLNFHPKKIVLYAPTFRDYAFNRLDTYLNDKNIFGYLDNDKLNQVLRDTETLILYKPHNLIDVHAEDTIFNDNIKLVTRSIMEKYALGSYELMKLADALICDYSSISFDYLYLNRPIIYNIYDIDLYRKYRGFPIEHMELLMPGDKVKTEEELASAIEHLFQTDQHEKEREIVHSIVNEVPLEGMIDRIIDFFIERG